MTTSFFQNLWNNPQRRLMLIGGSAAGLILLIGVSAHALGKEYLLDAAIQDTAQLISQDALFFIEVRNPAETVKAWEASPAAQRLSKLPAYQNLQAAPQLQAYNDLSYVLELKTGLTPTDIVAGLDRPLGFAWFPEQAFVLVARTDLKSRIGIQLLKTLKGKTIQLPNEADFDRLNQAANSESGDGQMQSGDDGEGEEDGEDADVINREEAAPVLLERRSELSNLEVTRIDQGSRSVYMILLGDVFFLSDSLERLEESLTLAGNAQARSLGTLKGMPSARTRLKAPNKQNPGSDAALLVYAAAAAENWGAAAATLGGDRGLIGVLRDPGGGSRAAGEPALYFDLFAAGESRFAAAANDSGGEKTEAEFAPLEFARIAPRDSLAQFISGRDAPARLLDYYEEVDGPAESFADRFSEFAAAAGLKSALSDSRRGGFSFIWRGVEPAGKSLYPHGVLAQPDANVDRLLTYGAAVFGEPEQKQSLQFQNVSYTRTARNGRRYAASAAIVKTNTEGASMGLLATRAPDLTAAISASLGNRPANSDHASFAALGDHAQAPVHLIVNLNEARLVLDKLFAFGAERNPAYSIKTIQRDVMPLVDAFRDYGVLHLATGANSVPASKADSDPGQKQSPDGALVVLHQ